MLELKLFEHKRRCIDTFLKPGEGVSAFSGFGNTFVVGTDRGRVLVFSTKCGGQWVNEVALDGLCRDESSHEPITQICCASALDLILLLVGDELVALEMKSELQVIGLCSSVSHCAINSHPSLDDPFSVQMAVAHSQQPFVRIGTVADTEFVDDRKVPTAGRVVKMSFSGQCLCYATEVGAFYVQNVQTKNGGAALKLFDGTTMGHAICTFGMEEFALSGIHELVVFVNVHGVSSRPPISVSGRRPIVGLVLKEPFLHVLSEDGTICIYSISDDKLVQALAFPTPKSQQSHQLATSTCQMENIDGIFLIAFPGDSALFELVPVSAAGQIEDQIQLGNLDAALLMLDKSAAFCTTAIEILEMSQLRKRVVFLLLQESHFSDGIALLLAIDDADCAYAFLSLIVSQRPEFGMEPITHTGEIKPPIERHFPEIPLEFVKQYLEGIVHRQRDDAQLDSLLSYCLARTNALLEDFDTLLLCGADNWNNVEFRRWLSIERRRPKWAAKLAVQRQCWSEAFATWEGQIGPNRAQEMPQEEDEIEMRNECYSALFRVQKYSEMASALPWLVQMNAKICMKAIEALETANSDEKCPPEEVVKLFQNSDPNLLLRYLDARIYELNIPSLHDQLLELYVHFILNYKSQDGENSEADQPFSVNECRQKLRHFLLFSGHFSVENATNVFGEGKSDQFRIEAILAEANEHNAVDCLRRVMSPSAVAESDFDPQHSKELFSAGQMLCTRFPSPAMLTTMLTLHLRFSSSDRPLRANVEHILSLLGSATDAIAVLLNLPDDLRSSAFVRSFLRRHVALRTNVDQWSKMRHELTAQERTRTAQELHKRLTRTKFSIDEQTKCDICERRLKADDEFVRHSYNGQLMHLRCFDQRQSIG